jgi:hypothetical protein
LKAIHNSGILAEPKDSALNLSRQNSQLEAVLREPWEEEDLEEVPSLDDPFLQETLQYYILRGQLARQSNASEQSGVSPLPYRGEKPRIDLSKGDG